MEGGKEAFYTQAQKYIDAEIKEIALVFCFLTSLDKVFSDVHIFGTIPYKKTRKNCEGISIKKSYYGSIKTKCRN